MPLQVRCAGSQIALSSDGTEASQQADDDLGRLVQWTLGSIQEKWEVKYTFTHVCGPNGGTVLGLGFGTKDCRLEEVDILEYEKLIVCDAYDGEVNVLGQQSQKDSFELVEPMVMAEEESIVASYDATKGMVRFVVNSHRCRSQRNVTEIVRETLKNRELYPTVAFANRRSKVRIELQSALMALPVPSCPRLLRTDFSAYLGQDNSDSPGGPVTFLVEGRQIQADRFLLSARSEYFERMLRGGMAEGRSNVVPIPKASYAAFEAVLRFLYSAGQAGEGLFRNTDAQEVLHLSVEFMLEDLTRLCEWKIMKSLTLENTLATFRAVVTVRSKVPVLADACVERLQGRLREVSSSKDFKELVRSEDAVRELMLALDEPNAKRRRLSMAGANQAFGRESKRSSDFKD